MSTETNMKLPFSVCSQCVYCVSVRSGFWRVVVSFSSLCLFSMWISLQAVWECVHSTHHLRLFYKLCCFTCLFTLLQCENKAWSHEWVLMSANCEWHSVRGGWPDTLISNDGMQSPRDTLFISSLNLENLAQYCKQFRNYFEDITDLDVKCLHCFCWPDPKAT